MRLKSLAEVTTGTAAAFVDVIRDDMSSMALANGFHLTPAAHLLLASFGLGNIFLDQNLPHLTFRLPLLV